MNLYLDDDIAGARLLQLLRQAGHTVQSPSDAGLAGEPDPVHLTHAIREGRVLLTRNYRDFELLHLLVRQAGGHHPGVLVVRRDDDPRRNMSPRDIARAVRNLEAAGLPLADDCVVLNSWQ